MVKSDGETTGMYVVELGVGVGMGGESCRRRRGEDEYMKGDIHVGDKCVG